MKCIKRCIITVTMMSLLTLGFGCGEKETNVPSVKLTASSVSSSASTADSSTHTHTVSIPFTDISASPASDIYQYRSDEINGHSHVIAMTKQQLVDINNGMRLVLTSSSPSTGSLHSHSWGIQGGNILYEKNCYNCHSNDKRGHSPMNVSFNPSQASSVMNPSGAPLSSTASTVPDPDYLPSTTLATDGAALYGANCASCHNVLISSAKLNRTFIQIKTAITGNSGGMSSLGSLSDVQIQAIANALVK